MIPKAPDYATPVEGEYSIKPSQIDASHHFWDAFGKMEVEVEARRIVLKAQKAGSWAPFRLEYSSLVDRGWIVKAKEDGLCRVTDAFILHCLANSPKK